MKRLKTPKFSFSLILNFLISTLIPFVLVTLLIANLYKYNYTRDVFNLVDNSLVSISQNIYLYLSELDRATLTPYYNEDFFATLKHIKESSGRQSVLEQAQLENSLGYLMSFIRYTREDIAGSIIVAGETASTVPPTWWTAPWTPTTRSPNRNGTGRPWP